MRRISIVGTSGSGKTTLARRLAASLGCPCHELDATFHQPGWTALPVDEFRRRAGEMCAAPAWVVEGNYSAVQDVVWARADTVVWLDLPLGLVAGRVLRRTLRRGVRGEELWNGNQESLRGLLRTRPEDNIVLWALTSHGRNRRRYAEAMADPTWSDLRFVRLCSRAEIDRFARAAGGPDGT